jgi:hypothetical protein
MELMLTFLPAEGKQFVEDNGELSGNTSIGFLLCIRLYHSNSYLFFSNNIVVETEKTCTIQERKEKQSLHIKTERKLYQQGGGQVNGK